MPKGPSLSLGTERNRGTLYSSASFSESPLGTESPLAFRQRSGPRRGESSDSHVVVPKGELLRRMGCEGPLAPLGPSDSEGPLGIYCRSARLPFGSFLLFCLKAPLGTTKADDASLSASRVPKGERFAQRASRFVPQSGKRKKGG